MAIIYIGFSHPKAGKVGAELIKWWSARPYSHVYIRFDSVQIPSTVYHAARGMVHFLATTNFVSQNIVVKEYGIELSEEKKLAILKYAISLCGQRYSSETLFKIFILELSRYINLVPKFYDSKGYICSELIGKICKDHLNIEFDKPTYLLTPANIDEKLAEACYGTL